MPTYYIKLLFKFVVLIPDKNDSNSGRKMKGNILFVKFQIYFKNYSMLAQLWWFQKGLSTARVSDETIFMKLPIWRSGVRG